MKTKQSVQFRPECIIPGTNPAVNMNTVLVLIWITERLLYLGTDWYMQGVLYCCTRIRKVFRFKKNVFMKEAQYQPPTQSQLQ